MSNLVPGLIAWIGLGLHLLVAVLVLRSAGPRSLVALLNLAVGGSILAYWAARWYSYLFQGIIWYLSDQWMPLYGLLVCILSAVTLSGRYQATTLNWLVFTLHAIVLLAAALFLTFFRFKRMI